MSNKNRDTKPLEGESVEQAVINHFTGTTISADKREMFMSGAKFGTNWQKEQYTEPLDEENRIRQLLIDIVTNYKADVVVGEDKRIFIYADRIISELNNRKSQVEGRETPLDFLDARSVGNKTSIDNETWYSEADCIQSMFDYANYRLNAILHPTSTIIDELAEGFEQMAFNEGFRDDILKDIVNLMQAAYNLRDKEQAGR